MLKKSTPSMNSKSLASRTIRIQHQADALIQNHQSAGPAVCPCQPGCSECCGLLFWVNKIEFEIICQALRQWPKEELEDLRERVTEQYELIRKEHPVYAAVLEQPGGRDLESLQKDYDMPDIHGYPCPLLHPDKMACRVYQARTLICRCFGSSKTTNSDQIACSVIGPSSQITWGPDTTAFFDQLFLLVNPIIQGEPVIERQYPMVYWLWMMFRQSSPGEIVIPDEEADFHKPYSEWIRAVETRSDR
ncbi:MAG: YkgJ family cysteine cluster protein [Solirubrobacterales bacterium]